MYRWNDEKLKKRYDRIKERMKEDYGLDEECLKTPTLESWKFNTKSVRIWSMIRIAYDLGSMRAIKDIDEGKTPITMS